MNNMDQKLNEVEELITDLESKLDDASPRKVMYGNSKGKENMFIAFI